LLTKILGSISLTYFVINTLLIINFFTEVVDGGNLFGELEGFPVLAPFFIVPIAILPAIMGFKSKKDKLCLWATILNIALFIFPFVYFFIGTLVGGP